MYIINDLMNKTAYIFDGHSSGCSNLLPLFKKSITSTLSTPG